MKYQDYLHVPVEFLFQLPSLMDCGQICEPNKSFLRYIVLW